MAIRFRHIALVTPGLRAAEEYYQAIFAAELIGREARLSDGLWYTMPFDKDWDDADKAGIDIGMVALRRDEMVLALFAGEPCSTQLLFIGVSMEPGQIGLLRSRLPRATEVTMDESSALEFRDRYGVRWQVSDSASRFRTSGDVAQRWLELPEPSS